MKQPILYSLQVSKNTKPNITNTELNKMTTKIKGLLNTQEHLKIEVKTHD